MNAQAPDQSTLAYPFDTDELVRLPPGTYPWQPSDTSLVIHTIKRANAQYNLGLTPKSATIESGAEINVRPGYLKGASDEAAYYARFYGLSAQGLGDANELHLFECKSTTERPISINPRWRLDDDLVVQCETNTLSFYPQKTPTSPADTRIKNDVFPRGELQVSRQWLDFFYAYAPYKGTEKRFNYYVWYPIEDELVTRAYRVSYATYKDLNLEDVSRPTAIVTFYQQTREF